MRAILCEMHGKPVVAEYKDGLVFIDGVEQPVKNIAEKDFNLFNEEIAALPKSDDPGYEALLNAVRAAFISKLLDNCHGEQCASLLVPILDHVNYDVHKYLGDTSGGIMRATLCEIGGKPVIAELRDGVVFIDGVEQPIKNITEKDFRLFNDEIAALPKNDDATGHEALVNAVRAPFLVKLLGNAVGDECISQLTHMLDHVHYDVLKYLGEVEDEVN